MASLDMWTLACLFKLTRRLNALQHTSHLYGFSPLWILACTTRLPNRVNRLLQTLHSNGFSSEWLCLCCVRCARVPKRLPHPVHLYLPRWTFICSHNLFWAGKCFSHWVQVYWFLRVCNILRLVKRCVRVNCLSLTVLKQCLDLSSCGCSLWSLLSASVFTSNELSSA